MSRLDVAVQPWREAHGQPPTLDSPSPPMPPRFRRLRALWSFGRAASGRSGARRGPALLALVLVLAAACALGLVALRQTGDTAATGIVAHERALAVAADAATFPLDAPAAAVALPDDWSRTRPEHSGVVWYRVAVDLPPPAAAGADADDVLALYIERVCSNFEVWLNGRRLYHGGRMAEPVTRHCYQPQLVVLPTALLRPQGNLLDVKVRGYAWREVASRDRIGGLSALRTGPLGELRGVWQARAFWNVTSAQIIGLTLGLFGLVAIGMGWINRRSSHLFYFGWLALAWAALTTQLWLAQLPLAHATVEFLIACLFAPVAGLAAIFLMRYARIRRRRIDLALLAQCVLLPLTLLVAGPGRLYVAAGAWYALLTLEVLAAMIVHLLVSWHRDRSEFGVMATVLTVLALVMGFELALYLRLAEGLRPEPLRLALPLLVIVVSARLAQLFGRALRAAELSRSTLQSRIRDASAVIERNFMQLAELRVEQVTEKERKRIAADLHDDLGAKLLTIVHTSESERISTLAREALEEMRLSVRGLTGKPMRVADALGDWRAETVSRLGQAGIEADWQSPPDEAAQLMSARAYVQTTRILREAVSNIIKHSGASRCKVQCAIDPHSVALVVQDNGRGIPLALDGKLDRGHGMTSMKHRAKQLHGQCLVESGPNYGTVIRLTLPL